MYFLLHKIFVLAGTLSLLTGVCSALLFRHKTYWLKIHKRCNSIAFVLLLAGISMAAAMIFQQNGEHLRGYHPVVGILTFAVTIIALASGFYQFKIASLKTTIRTTHRITGWIALLMLILSLFTGLTYVGIL